MLIRSFDLIPSFFVRTDYEGQTSETDYRTQHHFSSIPYCKLNI
jgi:hypothetical protein